MTIKLPTNHIACLIPTPVRPLARPAALQSPLWLHLDLHLCPTLEMVHLPAVHEDGGLLLCDGEHDLSFAHLLDDDLRDHEPSDRAEWAELLLEMSGEDALVVHLQRRAARDIDGQLRALPR